MPGTPLARRAPARGTPPTGPIIAPSLLLRRGHVCLPGAEGPVVARRGSGQGYDVFDVLDQLSPHYPFLYLVDLDGLERNDPQLEYIQELSRDMPLWVDSGVRHADQAIDVIVAGAQKAVLSSAYLRGPKELRRAWRLTTELVFEIETVQGRTEPVDESWGSADPAALARVAREVGIGSVVLSARGEEVDWTMVGALAQGGPTWVDGSFSPRDALQLATAHAAGGIFHLDEVLANMDKP